MDPGATKRIQKELITLSKDLPEFCTAQLTDEKDISVWSATIEGPKETPYSGGTFHMKVEFPADYPFKPPKITFITPVYHPNIGDDGEICMDILQDQWTPALTTCKVLISICSLLAEANCFDSLRPDIAHIYN